jgi:uncharacterized membrane protein
MTKMLDLIEGTNAWITFVICNNGVVLGVILLLGAEAHHKVRTTDRYFFTTFISCINY